MSVLVVARGSLRTATRPGRGPPPTGTPVSGSPGSSSSQRRASRSRCRRCPTHRRNRRGEVSARSRTRCDAPRGRRRTSSGTRPRTSSASSSIPRREGSVLPPASIARLRTCTRPCSSIPATRACRRCSASSAPGTRNTTNVHVALLCAGVVVFLDRPHTRVDLLGDPSPRFVSCGDLLHDVRCDRPHDGSTGARTCSCPLPRILRRVCNARSLDTHGHDIGVVILLVAHR